MKKATLIATQLLMGAAVVLLVGCSAGTSINAPEESHGNKLSVATASAERVTVAGMIASIDYDERQITLERSSAVIVITEDAKLLGTHHEKLRFADLRTGMEAQFSGEVKDKRILVADYVELGRDLSRAPLIPGTSLNRVSATASERVELTDFIATIDYDERRITVQKSSALIVIDDNAKLVGDSGDSRRNFRIFDLQPGQLVKFAGYIKDGRILVADYVEVNSVQDKLRLSIWSQ